MKPWLWILIALTFFFLGGYVFKKSAPSAPQTSPVTTPNPLPGEGAAIPRSDSGQNMPVPRQNSPGSQNSQPQFQSPEPFGAEELGEEGFIEDPNEPSNNFAPQPNFAPPPPPPDFAPEPFIDEGGDVPPPFEPPPPLEDDEGGFIPPPVPFDNPEEADPISFQVGS